MPWICLPFTVARKSRITDGASLAVGARLGRAVEVPDVAEVLEGAQQDAEEAQHHGLALERA